MPPRAAKPPALLGSSPAQKAFVEQLRLAAASEATVLIVGESGTGKSTAAAALHAASARAAGPLVEVHLGALTPTLIESELFGHEAGAFTDAKRARTGAFRRAEGGTLVLDDVGLLPKPSQVKLLRALQERVVEPLGSETPVPVDARFVATANRDLKGAMASGKFREDLYYRLAVVTLEAPPLRARPEDLPELAAGLLGRIAERLGLPARALSDAALERLAAHPWPGNVRELENALERVCALAPEGGEVAAEELAFLDEAVAGVEHELARAVLAAGVSLADLEEALLEEALAEQRGNVSAAARRLGLTRRAFEYRTAKKDTD